MSATTHPFPVVRWLALAWLLLFVPYNWAVHGGWNLLFFCDVAVILTCVGIDRGSPLLLSSQAVSVLVVQSTWTLDLVVRLCGGSGVLPGRNWMLNPEIPLLFRTISLYHVVWPLFLLWCLTRTGYDRRALGLAASIALVLVSAGRLAPVAANVNCAHDLFGRAWQPAWVHVGLVAVGLTLLVYWPTHRFLGRIYPEPGGRGTGQFGKRRSAATKCRREAEDEENPAEVTRPTTRSDGPAAKPVPSR